MTISGNFDFSPYGEPPGGFSAPGGLYTAIVFLTFFNCLDVRNIRAEFNTFITICTNVVLMALNDT